VGLRPELKNRTKKQGVREANGVFIVEFSLMHLEESRHVATPRQFAILHKLIL
jgi:hypothetical protein